MMKTRKSILKRFKITKTGKILRRPSGLDHGLAKKSGNKIKNVYLEGGAKEVFTGQVIL